MTGEAYSVYTNNPTTGPMRCVGHPQGTFAQEVHMDIIAEKLGMDPVEFRLKNYARLEDGDQFRKIPFTSNGMEECITRAAETFQWKAKRQKAASQAGPVKKGYGMAIHACRHGGMPAGNAVVGDAAHQCRWHGQCVHRRDGAWRRAEDHDGDDRG